MIKKKIYIASPYTEGDGAKNVRLQMDAGNALMDMGHAPFIPLLTHFQHMVHPRGYQDWIDFDLVWVKACDAVVRIRPVDRDGFEILSNGAAIEEAFARENNIPVYTVQTVEEIKNLKF